MCWDECTPTQFAQYVHMFKTSPCRRTYADMSGRLFVRQADASNPKSCRWGSEKLIDCGFCGAGSAGSADGLAITRPADTGISLHRWKRLYVCSGKMVSASQSSSSLQAPSFELGLRGRTTNLLNPAAW